MATDGRMSDGTTTKRSTSKTPARHKDTGRFTKRTGSKRGAKRS